MPDFLQPIVGTLSAHPYLFIFVGLLFVGELVLLPAIFLTTTGQLELAYVMVASMTATMLSDFAWYSVGRRFPAAALLRLPGQGTSRLARGLSDLFTRRGARVLFLSKFVYGTRVAAQILAGLHDMPVRLYLLVNLLGVTALTLVLSGIAWTVTGTTEHYIAMVHSAKVAFVAFVLVAATGYLGLAIVARRRWSL